MENIQPHQARAGQLAPGFEKQAVKPAAALQLLKGLDSSAKSMSGIAVACACAGIIVGVVTMTGLGHSMILIISGLAGENLIILLLISAIISIILGTGLPNRYLCRDYR